MLGVLAGFVLLSSVEGVVTDFELPASCPPASEIRQRATARGVTFDDGDERAWRLTATVDEAGSWHVTQRVEDPGGASQERTFTGVSCDDVIEGAVLVAATFFETHANARRAPLAVGPATPEPSPEEPDVSSESARVRLLASAGAVTGVTDGVTPSFGAGVEYLWAARGVWTPSLQLRALSSFGAVASWQDPLRSQRHGVGVDVCPTSWGNERWQVRPCARGAVAAWVVNRAAGATGARVLPWVGVGASAEGRWYVTSRWALTAAVDVEGSAVRPRILDGDAVAFQVPLVSAGLHLGVSWSIW